MSAYKLEQLLNLWATEQLTAEQVIGQLLLHLQALTARVRELERRLAQAGLGRSASASAATNQEPDDF